MMSSCSYLWCLLLALILPLCFMSNGILLEVNGESCTEGFMDYSLLQGKAANPSGSLSMTIIAENTDATRWIIIEDQDENFLKRQIMFTCATVITDILIGIDIRTVNDSIGRTLYPKFEVWAPTNDDDVFTREMSIEIRLTPDNFTTNGQYLFTLPTPLSVSSGYRIGVYQPPDDRSVVRFHYMNLPGGIHGTGKVKSDRIDEANIKISGVGKNVHHKTWYILVYPIAQNTSCFIQPMPQNIDDFISFITDSNYVSDTRIFPDIRFTCHGIITNWIVIAPPQVMPVIKIRHSNGLTTTAATLITSASNAVSISQNLYNFTMSNEITVQPGDILMIESDATNLMFYQHYNGPHNYRLRDNNELTALDTNDYPLISVVVEPISVTTTTVSTTSSIPTSNTISLPSVMRPPSSSSTAMYTTTVNAVPTTTTTTTVPTNSVTTTSISITSSLSTSTTMTSTPGQGNAGNNASMILIAVISAVIVLLVVTIIVILIVSVVVFRKKRKLSLPVSSSTRNDSNSNHVYTDVGSTGNDKGRLGAINNPNYQPQVLYDEAKPASNKLDDMIANASYEHATPRGIESAESIPVYADPTVTNNRKQQATQVLDNDMYSLLGAGIYVPTAHERSGGQSEEIYSTLINELYSSTYSKLDHTGGNAFFIEDTEYWEPDSNTDGIYQQLSDRKYREIIRHQIKVTDYLGSGQFGTVNKGVWTTPTAGSVSVAIKTLNDNTSEDERVKFLQEAAIMGQFHHPNVVKLHGVVTIGHPTMIVLELISGGDLKKHLNKFKPPPGELVLSSVPSILLSFCRQIASGMEYLSRKKFVHRDLAARNILVSDEGTGICKIADFGMSRDLQDESYYISQTKKIPIKWTAPEALHYKKYSSASDVWSYGAVMYEIWSIGHKPFEKSTNQESIRLVDSGYRLPPPPGCPKPMYKLMMQCWNPDTHNRPSFSDISSSLSSPDKQLLMINEEDPVTVLGGALGTSHSLYNDLQYMYKN